jgi:hypothetical protein
LLGETVREIGLLFVAFGPLDVILNRNDAALMWGFLGAGVILVAVGMALELRK